MGESSSEPNEIQIRTESISTSSSQRSFIEVDSVNSNQTSIYNESLLIENEIMIFKQELIHLRQELVNSKEKLSSLTRRYDNKLDENLALQKDVRALKESNAIFREEISAQKQIINDNQQIITDFEQIKTASEKEISSLKNDLLKIIEETTALKDEKAKTEIQVKFQTIFDISLGLLGLVLVSTIFLPL